MDIAKLGSLYFNGRPQNVGVNYNYEQISFGDTVLGKELQWVRLQGGLLIADRCVCTHVSWEQLDQMGFVYGSPVRIDGEYYLCRCLKVGNQTGVPNEWNDALDEAGEDDTLWHWNDEYFWGQETSEYNASSRAARGWASARYWSHYTATTRRVYVGFRPVLEPLDSEPCSPDTLVGKTIKAYCPDGVIIEGRLVDCSDYDIVLRASSSLPVNCPWAVKQNRSVIINRKNINWLKEI